MSINLSVVFYGKGVPRRRWYLCAAGGYSRKDGGCPLWGCLVALEDGALEVSGDVAAACGAGARRRWRADSGRRARGAAACIHLWPARGASGAQGRCAAWRSPITWRRGCPTPCAPPPVVASFMSPPCLFHFINTYSSTMWNFKNYEFRLLQQPRCGLYQSDKNIFFPIIFGLH